MDTETWDLRPVQVESIAAIGYRSSARFGQKRQLLASRVPELVDETGGIVAGEAMVGELRLSRVAAGITHGAIGSLDGQERERVGADKSPHPLEVHAGGEQLLALGSVDAVEIRIGDRRRRDAEVDLARACFPHHLHDLDA